MLKIKSGYTNFVQLFTSQQEFESAQTGKLTVAKWIQDSRLLNGRMAHIFQAGAVNRNNTNTHNYEINNYQPKFSGQSTD